MPRRALALALALVPVALALVSCDDEDGPCPDGWYGAEAMGDAEVDGPRCIPPLPEEQAIRERVGTGLYGYSTQPIPDTRTDECVGQALMSGLVGAVIPKPEETTFFPDGHWELRLEPGKRYRISRGNMLVSTWAAARAPNVELEEGNESDQSILVLEAGQTYFARERFECMIPE